MLFEANIRKITTTLKTTTVRNFDGGWNVVDSDLNLAPRFARVLDNMFRGEGGYYQKRYGTRAFAGGDDGAIVVIGSVSKTVTTSAGSKIVNIEHTSHGLLTGDNITIASFSADIDGIPATDFNGSFEITYVDTNNYNIRVATAGSAGTSASRTFDLTTNTHTINGVLVNMWYFAAHVIAVDTRGQVFKIDSAGIITKIWSDQFARALSGAPMPWSAMTFASAAVFNGDLIICNGIDKPLLVNLDNSPAVNYLQDLGTGSNANTPIGRYVAATPNYLVIAGDPTAVDRVHISNGGTSGTWQGDPAPNDATQKDLGAYSGSMDQTIRGITRFRNFLLAVFDDSIVPVGLGEYDGSGNHVPNIDDSIEQHGTISHRSIVSLGNDVLMADHIGVPSIAQAALTNTIRPDRVSELVDPVIQRNVLRLSVGEAEDRVFAVYNPRDRQYMLFFPDYEQDRALSIPYNSMESLDAGSGRVRIYMTDPHDLEVGKQFVMSGATAFDGLTTGQLNTTQTVAVVLDDFTFEIDTAGVCTNGNTMGGGGGADINYQQTETIGYIYTSFHALKIRSWARFRQWNWRCACTSQLGRVLFGSDRRVYFYGSREDPIAGDYFNEYDAIWANSTAYAVGDRLYDSTFGRVYECLKAHTSSPAAATFEDDRVAHADWWIEYEGDEIDFTWELPWTDFDARMEVKDTKYIGFDTTGTASFTAQMFADRLLHNEDGDFAPILSDEFVGGHVRGYGGQATTYGGGKLTSEERPWPWPMRSKIAKLRFTGSSSKPLAFVSISLAYQKGTVYR